MNRTYNFPLWQALTVLFLLLSSATVATAQSDDGQTRIFLPLVANSNEGQNQSIDNSAGTGATDDNHLLPSNSFVDNGSLFPRDADTTMALTGSNSETTWLQPLAALNLSSYASQCAQKMGTVPAFDCTKGKVLATNNPTLCPELGGTNCTANSRFGSLNTGNANVTTLYICRKYQVVADPSFHDIAVIQYNRQTGETCWYQSPVGSPISGKNVPSPSSSGANQFWKESAALVDTCQRCHAADPFILTPYLVQAVTTTPQNWNPNGPYISNYLDIFGTTPQPSIYAPLGNECLGCHRFGASPGALEHIENVFNNRSMPTNIVLPSAQWHTKFDDDFVQLRSCSEHPEKPECGSFHSNGTIAVDTAFGGVQLGTISQPFRSVTQAYYRASAGATISVRGGVYPENLLFAKPLTVVATNGIVAIGK